MEKANQSVWITSLKKAHRYHEPWVWTLLIQNVSTRLGTFATLSILSLYFMKTLQMSAAWASGMMLFSSFSTRFSHLLISPFLGKVSAKTLFIIIYGLGCVSFLLLAFTKNPICITLLLAFVGLCQGTHVVLTGALLSHQSEPTKSVYARYTAYGIGCNVAAATGPLIGNALFTKWPQTGAFIASAIFLLISMPIIGFKMKFIPPISRNIAWTSGFWKLMKNPTVRGVFVLTALGWFCHSQFSSTLPVYVSMGLGRQEHVGLFFTANALIVILCSIPLTKLFQKWNIGSHRLCWFSFIFFGMGCLFLSIHQSILFTYLAVAAWTIQEIMLFPILDTLIAERSCKDTKVIGFTLNVMCAGIGEGAGYWLGLQLAGKSLSNNNWLHLFGMFGLLSIAFCVLILVLRLGSTRHPIGTASDPQVAHSDAPQDASGAQ